MDPSWTETEKLVRVPGVESQRSIDAQTIQFREYSVLEGLPPVDNDRLDLPLAEVDFNLQGAEEKRVVLFDLFDGCLQEAKNPVQIPIGLFLFSRPLRWSS
jgi:hypothetical protein